MSVGCEKLAFLNVFRYGLLMSIDQIAAEALRLSPSQRAVLAESLWESLADPFEVVGTDESSRRSGRGGRV